MKDKENVWFSGDRASALFPLPATSGGSLPPPQPDPPPDPPDPSLPLGDFPSLSVAATTPRKSRSPMQISPTQGTASRACNSGCVTPTTDASKAQTLCSKSIPGSGNQGAIPKITIPNPFEGFVALPSKSFPLINNSASTSHSFSTPPRPAINQTQTPPPIAQTPLIFSSINQTPPPIAPLPKPFQPPPPKTTSNPPKPQSWSDKAKQIADRSLRRLAHPTLSEAGIPEVTVPDAVFERGASLHKDFVVGSFFARMPSYKAIENVLNYLWGKGVKLEIHTNKLERSMIVRIPNEFIRKKVLEKRLWYVGTAMFHVAPWSATQKPSTPELSSIPLWAHLKGVPLDLRSLEGLSFAAGLVGEPKETDEFTKNLSNIEVAHVKVEADLTSVLPPLVHLKRQSGEIIPVQVEYPWVPPSCTLCNQIGHILKDCLKSTPAWVPTGRTTTAKKKQPEAAAEACQETNQNINSQCPAESSEVNLPKDNPLTVIAIEASPSLPSPSLPSPSPTLSFAFLATPPLVPPPSPDLPAVSLTSDPFSVALVVALPAPPPPRKPIYPSRNKPSLKRPFLSPSHSSLLALNPFAILSSSPKKSIKLSTDEDHNHPPIPLASPFPIPAVSTPSVGPLLLEGVPPASSQ